MVALPAVDIMISQWRSYIAIQDGIILRGSEKVRDVFAHLVFPIGPIVAAHRSPVIERMANAFAGEDFRKMISGPGIFPLASAGRKVNVAGGELTIDPGIAKIGEIVHGVIEIKIVV